MGCIFGKEDKFVSPEPYDMGPIKNTPVIFVSGVPGAGNQTVAQTISGMTGYYMIKPGELVRNEAKKDTARGHMIAEKMAEKQDIPEQLTVDLIKEEMLAHAESLGFILVGFPKSPSMSTIFHRQVKKPEKIVALEVDDEIAATRLQAKLSELGRPEEEINSARQIVTEAAPKVKDVQKRYGREHILTVDSNKSPSLLKTSLQNVSDALNVVSY